MSTFSIPTWPYVARAFWCRMSSGDLKHIATTSTEQLCLGAHSLGHAESLVSQRQPRADMIVLVHTAPPTAVSRLAASSTDFICRSKYLQTRSPLTHPLPDITFRVAFACSLGRTFDLRPEVLSAGRNSLHRATWSLGLTASAGTAPLAKLAARRYQSRPACSTAAPATLTTNTIPGILSPLTAAAVAELHTLPPRPKSRSYAAGRSCVSISHTMTCPPPHTACTCTCIHRALLSDVERLDLSFPCGRRSAYWCLTSGRLPSPRLGTCRRSQGSIARFNRKVQSTIKVSSPRRGAVYL